MRFYGFDLQKGQQHEPCKKGGVYNRYIKRQNGKDTEKRDRMKEEEKRVRNKENKDMELEERREGLEGKRAWQQ